MTLNFTQAISSSAQPYDTEETFQFVFTKIINKQLCQRNCQENIFLFKLFYVLKLLCRWLLTSEKYTERYDHKYCHDG